LRGERSVRARVVATGTTRGQHSTFSRLTYPASLAFVSPLAVALPSLSPASYIFRDRPVDSRARERIIALIASRAGDARSRRSLFVILVVCLALLAAEERKKTGNGVRMHRRCAVAARGKFPARGFASVPRTSPLVVLSRRRRSLPSTGIFQPVSSRIETTTLTMRRRRIAENARLLGNRAPMLASIGGRGAGAKNKVHNNGDEDGEG